MGKRNIFRGGIFMKQKAIILFSSGLDSTTVLYYALSKGYECHCLIFDYGQKHNKEVQNAVFLVCCFRQVYFARAADLAVHLEHDHALRHKRRQLWRLSDLGAGRRGLGGLIPGIRQRLHRQDRDRTEEKEGLRRGRDRLERLSSF